MNLTLHWAKRSLVGLLCLAAMSVANPILAQQTQTPVQVIDAAAPEAAPSAPIVTPFCDNSHYFIMANGYEKYGWYEENGTQIAEGTLLEINELPDGLYYVIGNETSEPCYFQLLGNASNAYVGTFVYKFPTFIHKDVVYEKSEIKFENNKVYVYGDIHYAAVGGVVNGPLIKAI